MATEVREREALAGVPTELYIGGQWRPASNAERLAVEDPATEEPLVEVADAQVEDALAALAAADEAQGAWGESPPRERGEILRRAYEEIIARRDELALVMTLEMGKTVAESRAEITYGAEFFRWFSEEAPRIHGRYMTSPTAGARIVTMRQPVGPCVFVTPWNFPLAMGARKIAPAIAAGCTIVVKPAQQTPLSMLALARILEQAGLPGGVLNVITASASGSVIEPLLRDPRTRKLSFTGSTDVGRLLIEQSAEQVLRVSMELGGNAPFLVFADADLDAAVEGAMVAKMRNVGEACTAANRFLVDEAVADGVRAPPGRADRRPAHGPRHGARCGRRAADRRGPAGQGRPARRGRPRAGRPAARGRRGDSRTRPLLPAHAPNRRTPRREAPRTGDLRTRRPDRDLRHGGRGARGCQPDRVWARRLPVHERPRRAPSASPSASRRAWWG